MTKDGQCDRIFEKIEKTIKGYHPSDNIEILKKAYEYAYNAHKDQKRLSGEPFVVHPVNVALILAGLNLDKETIVAGLLHDVVEDTECSIDDISKEFGEEVAFLVDGVTKIEDVIKKQKKRKIEASNIKKIIMATTKDIRVILIKFADRLHNLRTLEYKSPERQIAIAKNTLDIYAPIASELGISLIETQLEDLSLYYLNNEKYNEISKKIEDIKEKQKDFLHQLTLDLNKIVNNNLFDVEISYKFKHIFSIYKKQVVRKETLEEMYDLYAINICTKDVSDCYRILGELHRNYKPIPWRIKDYIALPKRNMYQALHTTLISKNGTPFEVQIKTFEMNKKAEYGIIADWKYSEDSRGKISEESKRKKSESLKKKLEWQMDINDEEEFLDSLKTELNPFDKKIYCFTPKGEEIELPTDASVLDFAYAIHSKIGEKYSFSIVNGNIAPLGYLLKNGDCVKIVCKDDSEGPQPFWLELVKSQRAKKNITQYLKKKKFDLSLKECEIAINAIDRQGILLEIVNVFTRYKKNIKNIYGNAEEGGDYNVTISVQIVDDRIIGILKKEINKIEGIKSIL